MLDFQIKNMADDEEGDGDEEPMEETTGEVFGGEGEGKEEPKEEEY